MIDKKLENCNYIADLLTRPMIAVDAEFDSETQRIFPCVTLWINDDVHFIVNRQYAFDYVVSSAKKYGVVHIEDFSDALAPIEKIREKLGLGGTIDLLFFFSPKDLEALFGWEIMEKCYSFDAISKYGSGHYGKIVLPGVNYQLKDLFPMSNQKLEILAKSLGMNTDWKNKGELDKTKMVEEMVNRPDEFFEYAAGDVEVLPNILLKATQNLNKIMKTVGISEKYYYDIYNVPTAIGGQVNGIILRYIWDYVKERSGLQPLYHYCLVKIGRLKSPNSLNKIDKERLANTKKSRARIEKEFLRVRNLSQANEVVKHNLDAIDFDMYEFTAYNEASVVATGRHFDTEAINNALVQGGRCCNENPWEDVFYQVLDADFMSAYGSILSNIMYPIGLPTIYHQTTNDLSTNWSEFSNKIIPKCDQWQATVSGKFNNLRQDLIYSKEASPRDIRSAVGLSKTKDKSSNYIDYDDDLDKIKGDFKLLHDELINGIITPEILEVASKVMSNREKKEFDKLKLVTAIYYSKSNKCETVEEWMLNIVKDKGAFTGRSKNGNYGLTDSRTRKYFYIPFNGLFGITTAERNSVKAKSKLLAAELESKNVKPSSNAEYNDMEAYQSYLKLFNNTGYGVTASIFKPVCNVLVANKITAAIRASAWMLAKAAGTFQSITDGGAYQPGNIRKINIEGKNHKYLPSLTVFADIRKLDKHRNISKASLGDLDWKNILIIGDSIPDICIPNKLSHDDSIKYKTAKASQVDLMLSDHLIDFWGHYGIKPLFTIEHKGETASYKWAKLNKSDYDYIPCNGKPSKPKVRGARQNKETTNYVENPKYLILKSMLYDEDEFPQDMNYQSWGLVSVTKYKEIHKSKNGYEQLKGCRPGETIVEDRTLHFNNYSYYLGDSCKSWNDELKARKNRPTSKTVNGKKVNNPLFERHSKEGIKSVLDRMMKDKLDDKGQRR